MHEGSKSSAGGRVGASASQNVGEEVDYLLCSSMRDDRLNHYADTNVFFQFVSVT